MSKELALITPKPTINSIRECNETIIAAIRKFQAEQPGLQVNEITIDHDWDDERERMIPSGARVWVGVPEY